MKRIEFVHNVHVPGDIAGVEPCHEMRTDPDGRFCLYSDVQKLMDEIISTVGEAVCSPVGLAIDAGGSTALSILRKTRDRL